MKPPPDRAAQFRRDFAPLEDALARGRKEQCVVVTPEMMIIELGLTPRRTAQLERLIGLSLLWFGPAYRAMRRHGLLKSRTRSWERWLTAYEGKRRSLLRASRPSDLRNLQNQPRLRTHRPRR